MKPLSIPGPRRDKLTHFTAVKEIINTCKNRFQRKHLKLLLSIFTVFPIHSYVRLNSNAIGKVIETYADQPMRPKLQIVFDSQRRKVLTRKNYCVAGQSAVEYCRFGIRR